LSTLLELTAIPRLPDNDDPAKQPMPERDPRDPSPVHDPENPPPEDLPPGDDSGPVDVTIEPDEIVPPPRPTPAAGNVVYESRIQMLEAFQYPGNLKNAPVWVDRNWIAYAAHFAAVRQLDPGPCLRVPLPSGVFAICRIGDYVCRQSVTIAQGLPADERIEVWERSQFEKLFVPTRAKNR